VVVVREFEELPSLDLDRHKVFQIVMNLLGNARQAVAAVTAGDRRITVRIQRRAPSNVVIEVEDTGCGIAPENMGNIFALGFTTKETGHGFGLHSSACSAMEMGGTLTVKSEGAGRGATFTLSIPLPAERAAAA
jgi:signal transduction histidine kinase